MARHDLVWNKVPTTRGEGAFTGDGLPGLMMYTTDDGTGLRSRVGRTDVMSAGRMQACRVPVGDAFFVAAQHCGGATQFVRIESLAGGRRIRLERDVARPRISLHPRRAET